MLDHKTLFWESIRGGRSIAGGDNTFVGYSAGNQNTTGIINSFFGTNAGVNNRTGSNNSFSAALQVRVTTTVLTTPFSERSLVQHQCQQQFIFRLKRRRVHHDSLTTLSSARAQDRPIKPAQKILFRKERRSAKHNGRR